jgi:hypothetical protein
VRTRYRGTANNPASKHPALKLAAIAECLRRLFTAFAMFAMFAVLVIDTVS